MNLKTTDEFNNIFKKESTEISCITHQTIIDINNELDRLASAPPPVDPSAPARYKPATNYAQTGIVLQKGARFAEMTKQLNSNPIIEEVHNEEQAEGAEPRPEGPGSPGKPPVPADPAQSRRTAKKKKKGGKKEDGGAT